MQEPQNIPLRSSEKEHTARRREPSFGRIVQSVADNVDITALGARNPLAGAVPAILHAPAVENLQPLTVENPQLKPLDPAAARAEPRVHILRHRSEDIWKHDKPMLHRDGQPKRVAAYPVANNKNYPHRVVKEVRVAPQAFYSVGEHSVYQPPTGVGLRRGVRYGSPKSVLGEIVVGEGHGGQGCGLYGEVCSYDRVASVVVGLDIDHKCFCEYNIISVFTLLFINYSKFITITTL